jgi:hypothetical protein
MSVGDDSGDGGIAVPVPVVMMPVILPMNNIVVNVAGGGANVLNGAAGAQIVWPGQGVWTIVFGNPVGAGPANDGTLYDINAPAHASGNRTFQGVVDMSNAYIFR